MAAPANAPTTTPASTSTSKGSRPCTTEAMPYTNPTVVRPIKKAVSWMPATGSDRKMPNTAPRPAPVETPRMSGETSGLRNRVW